MTKSPLLGKAVESSVVVRASGMHQMKGKKRKPRNGGHDGGFFRWLTGAIRTGSEDVTIQYGVNSLY
ncbi:hypothetical protein RHGRI_017317 [Rhododendron griersonianum]|uniref:Uncharacterized protein n=1 Tax=Rhododendron griersonianum TaxID=479676 RepID=A0AAV6JXC3_9ERIC|nr:hypothetical protein RHGRI_017317 [Rhododendron griersonianum]